MMRDPSPGLLQTPSSPHLVLSLSFIRGVFAFIPLSLHFMSSFAFYSSLPPLCSPPPIGLIWVFISPSSNLFFFSLSLFTSISQSKHTPHHHPSCSFQDFTKKDHSYSGISIALSIASHSRTKGIPVCTLMAKCDCVGLRVGRGVCSVGVSIVARPEKEPLGAIGFVLLHRGWFVRQGGRRMNPAWIHFFFCMCERERERDQSPTEIAKKSGGRWRTEKKERAHSPLLSLSSAEPSR